MTSSELQLGSFYILLNRDEDWCYFLIYKKNIFYI